MSELKNNTLPNSQTLEFKQSDINIFKIPALTSRQKTLDEPYIMDSPETRGREVLETINQSMSGYLNLKSSSAFATRTGLSVPPPIGRVERVSPLNESKLHFPTSPAFQPNYSNKKPVSLQNIVEFCHTKNIPFQNEERMFYRLNKQKQIHRRYKHALNHCFETNRPL